LGQEAARVWREGQDGVSEGHGTLIHLHLPANDDNVGRGSFCKASRIEQSVMHGVNRVHASHTYREPCCGLQAVYIRDTGYEVADGCGCVARWHPARSHVIRGTRHVVVGA
jgi:hypothetical protein